MNQRIKPLVVGSIMLGIGFLHFIYHLINYPKLQTDSIYSYYQHSYYMPLTSGKLPWIGFGIEYPPLSAYAILFPAFIPGLTLIAVSILRALACLVLSFLTLRLIERTPSIPRQVALYINIGVGLMACIIPALYYGVFDWTICLLNLYLGVLLFGGQDRSKPLPTLWPTVLFGTAIKIMPLLAAPFLLPLANKESKSQFGKWAAIFTLIHIPFVVFGLHGFKVFVNYHRFRPVDCFSIYAFGLDVLQRFGLINVTRDWSHATIEVQGPIGMQLAKLSLPLFAVAFIALWVWSNKKRSLSVSFGSYSVSILLYVVISKVSQQNYVVWILTSIFAIWLAGYRRPDFLKTTAILGILFVAIGWFQDTYFVANLQNLVPWSTIFANGLRHGLLIYLVVISLREFNRTPIEGTDAQLAPAA